MTKRNLKLTTKKPVAAAKSETPTKAPTTAKEAKTSAKTKSPAKTKPEVDNKPRASVTRDIAGIARMATNFGQQSDRDVAYLRSYRTLFGNKPFTVAQCAGQRAEYDGSNKLSDVGAIVRLAKGGSVKFEKSTGTVTLTTAGFQAGKPQ